jgi:hypothetical protein
MVMPSTNPTVNSPATSSAANPPVDPEVLKKPERRQFTAEYKLKILQETDSCEPGQIGAILRREAIPYLYRYSYVSLAIGPFV